MAVSCCKKRTKNTNGTDGGSASAGVFKSHNQMAATLSLRAAIT